MLKSIAQTFACRAAASTILPTFVEGEQVNLIPSFVPMFSEGILTVTVIFFVVGNAMASLLSDY